MRNDVSGWTTPVTAEDIDRYAHSGAWRDVTLADCARQQVRMRGDRVAVIDGTRSSSYADQVSTMPTASRERFAPSVCSPDKPSAFSCPTGARRW